MDIIWEPHYAESFPIGQVGPGEAAYFVRYLIDPTKDIDPIRDKTLPFRGVWNQALLESFLGHSQFAYVVPLPDTEPPYVTAADIGIDIGPGAYPQYQHAIQEYNSRHPPRQIVESFLRDWRWVIDPRTRGHRQHQYWSIANTQTGMALINLVVQGSGSFDTWFRIGVGLITFGFAQGSTVGGDEGGTTGGTGGVPGDVVGDGNTTGITLDGVLSDIESSITADVSTAFDSLTGSIGDIVGNIGDIIGSVSDTVGSLVSSVSDTFHQVTSLVNNINENLIKPITGPITSILENYKTLQEGLTRDLHSGVTGLLRIPQDIAGALTSVDATMSRTVAMLGAQNADLVASKVVPGLATAGAEPMEKTRAGIANGLEAYGSNERDHALHHIHDDPSVQNIDNVANIALGVLKGEYGWLGHIVGATLDVLMMLPTLLTYQEPKTELYHQIGRRKWPTTALEIADTLAALRRGILDRPDAMQELSGHGLNTDRIAVLEELERLLPGEAEALDWQARGIIDADGVRQVLTARGWRADDQARMIQAHKRLPAIAEAITWYHRGLIGAPELYDIMGAYDLREADKARSEEATWALPGAADVFAYMDRKAAISGNVAPFSLNTPPEQGVLDELRRIGIPERTADLLWVNHFQLLPAPLAVHAWFRGYINRTQLEGCLSAAGLVREQWQNYIDLQRPLLPARSIPAYIAAGVISEGEGIDIIRHSGYDDVTAQRIVNFAKTKHHPVTTPAAASALHGLASGAVMALYDAGTIDRSQAHNLLVESGQSEEAADLNLQVRDIHNQVAERNAEADLVVSRALAGQTTFDQAQSQLDALGLTTSEIARHTRQMHRLLIDKTKIPSESQILSMYKKTLITRDRAAEVLSIMGYSPEWAELLIKLEEAGHASAPTNPATAPHP